MGRNDGFWALFLLAGWLVAGSYSRHKSRYEREERNKYEVICATSRCVERRTLTSEVEIIPLFSCGLTPEDERVYVSENRRLLGCYRDTSIVDRVVNDR